MADEQAAESAASFAAAIQFGNDRKPAMFARLKNLAWQWGGFVVLLAAISATSLNSYVLFHSLVEIFRIVVIFGIAALVWNAREQIDDPFLLVAGLAYPAIGMLELLHTLAYKGMCVFPADANLPTQLWIAFRACESAALLMAALLPVRGRLAVNSLAAGFLAVGTIVGWLVLSGRFPDCFVEGVGLTPFKVDAEYAITVLFLAALPALWLRRSRLPEATLPLLMLSVVCGAMAELAFTEYVSVYGMANRTGHLLLLASTYFLYRAVLLVGIRKPQVLLYHQLNRERELLAGSEAALARKVAERTAEINAINRELEARVERRTADLETANKELEAFAYSVSHDLRAPLRAIDGFSQMLLEDYRDRLDAAGQHQLEVVRMNAVRMNKLIDDILAFSRCARNPLAPEAVDIAAVARNAFAELAAAAPERKMRLVVGNLPAAAGDRTMIAQVLTNLLSNAVKFTRPREEALIELEGRVGDGELIYCLKDNGVGFDMQYVDKLFGVFQRLHGVEEFEGTGVGLAIVKRVIQRHGGRVWAEGKVGEGADFFFTLPMIQPQAEATEPTAAR
jgi:signal transduction histidine kinase